MNPELYLADLEAKPAALADLAETLASRRPLRGAARRCPTGAVPGHGQLPLRRRRGRAAPARRGHRRLRRVRLGRGRPTRAGPETLVVPISATGGSRETLDAVARYAGGPSFVAALTNTPGSALTEAADLVVPMHAGEERGGVVLPYVPAHARPAARAGVPPHRATGATCPAWYGGPPRRRPTCSTAGTSGCRWRWNCSTARTGSTRSRPAERLSSAEQSALMFREGPRRPADACETGDWAHVDVYLTKTLDYRALLFPGSRYDEQAMDWVRQRGSTVVTVGGRRQGRHGRHPLRARRRRGRGPAHRDAGGGAGRRLLVVGRVLTGAPDAAGHRTRPGVRRGSGVSGYRTRIGR